MRRVISILLIILILGSTVTTFASMDEKLDKHWSKKYIEKDFLAHYFPYLAKNNYEGLDPNGHIRKHEFILSLVSLYKEYGLDTKSMDLGSDGILTRKDILKIIGEGLTEFNLPDYNNKIFPFKDINTMDNSSIELLILLYNLEIIHGISPKEFGPSEKLSQAEAIIILQRLKGVLKPMEQISFNTMGIMQSYNNEESIIVKDSDERVTVTITKSFPNPGYSLSVGKIIDTRNGYKIHLNTSSPEEGLDLLQVITYKTITVEIEKEELKKPAPYTFIVEGDDFPSGL